MQPIYFKSVLKETQTLRLFIFISLLTLFENTFSQCETLQFAELGYEPANCRTASYQSGNGVVYAAACGGTPDYTYQWTNLYNGSETSNTVLGGVNPGEYHIKVTDDIGCVITATVKVDSVIPIADFEMVSMEIDSSSGGSIVALVSFVNKSKHCNDYPTEWQDLNHSWNSGGSSTWVQSYFQEPYTVEISQPGFYEVCLASQNNNGCADTLCKSITISEPLFEDETVEVYYSSVTGDVSIEVFLTEPVYFNLIDLNGGTSIDLVLAPGTNALQLNAGIYAYQIISSTTADLICSGTIAVY